MQLSIFYVLANKRRYNRDMKPGYFVRVDVANFTGQDGKTFWYSSDTQLKVGQICEVPFGKRSSLGVVLQIQSAKPANITGLKAVTKIYEHIPLLPKYLLETAEWLKEYYVASPYAVWTTLLPSGLRAKPRNASTSSSKKPLKPLNVLNSEQQIALERIVQSTKPTLLEGITGSGKTEVYLHLIAEALKKKSSTVVLVPEIMLTTQLADRLAAHFDTLYIVHSGLSVAERKRIWLECNTSSQHKPVIVVGPRSALWMPLHNLGLIIIDEEHEPSYKQESFLRYNALHVAGHIASTKPAQLVLGSATPQVNTKFLVDKNIFTLAELHQRHNSSLPEVTIVDKNNFSGLLSPELTRAISKTLKDNKQVLLLLNRRGSASSLICDQCGQATRCPNCDIALSFHGDIARLLCHYCGYRSLPPTSCKHCGGELKFVGSGTQKLFEEISHQWPDTRVARLDRDNATWQNMHTLFRDLQSGAVDIVVGTQMISRGLDIANLRLVGIVDADTSLAVPDFTSTERTYQLLAQTAGRAGRRKELGTVIIQTRNPKQVAITAAATHTPTLFYQQELATRKRYAYPPYVYLVKLWYAHANPTLAEKHSADYLTTLQSNRAIRVLGPTPALQKRQSGKYVWQVIIKAKTRAELTKIVHTLPRGWQAEFDPISVI